MKRFAHLSRPFNMTWNYVLGWHHFAKHNIKRAALSWKCANELAKKQKNNLFEYRTDYLLKAIRKCHEKSYVRPSNPQEFISKVYQIID